MSIQLQEIDEDWEPNDDEINEYAEYIGINPKTESELLFLAREGLKAPLPPGWIAAKTEDGEVYYQNQKTKEALWDHPSDEMYKQRVIEERAKKQRKPILAPVPTGQPVAKPASGGSLLNQFQMMQSQKPKEMAGSDFEKVPKQSFQDDNFLNKPSTRTAVRAPSPVSNMKDDEDSGPQVDLHSETAVKLAQRQDDLSKTVKDKSQVSSSIQKQFDSARQETSAVHMEDAVIQQQMNAKEILKLTQQHADQVRQLSSQQSAELTQMNKKHFENLSKIQQENQQEIRRVQSDHDEQIQRLRSKLSQEFMTIQNQFALKFEGQMNNVLLSTAKPDPDLTPQQLGVDVQNAQIENKARQLEYQKLQAQNALLQQQIIDVERVGIERHKMVNQLQNDTDAYQQRIQTLAQTKESMRAEYEELKHEVDRLSQQLNDGYKQKQFQLNQKNEMESQRHVQIQQPAVQMQSEQKLNQLVSVDIFSVYGSALVTVLPDTLRNQLLQQKQLLSTVQQSIQQEKAELDLRIKSLEAKRASFTAESRLLNVDDRTAKQSLVQQRKTIDQEAVTVQNLIRQFKEGQDWAKKQKSVLGAVLTTALYSVSRSSDLAQLVLDFIQSNDIKLEDFLSPLTLETSGQLEHKFEALRRTAHQVITADELRRLQAAGEGFLVRDYDFKNMAVKDDKLQLTIELPPKVALILKRYCVVEGELTYDDFDPKQKRAAWVDELRKGLK